MRARLFSILLLTALLLVSCTAGKGDYLAYYMTYDAVDVHAEPSEHSPVTMKLICDRRPSSYSEKKAEIPYAFIFEDRNPVPVGIKKFDESGEWGYFSEKVPFILDWKGWIKLDQLIFCGETATADIKPTYEAKEDWIDMYKHPKLDEKDKLVHKLKKGDKVLAHRKSGSWAFVEWVRFSQAGKEAPKYGWVQLKNFRQIEDASYAQLKDGAYEAMQERVLSNSGQKGEWMEKGIRHAVQLKAALLQVFKYGALVAILVALLFLFPAIKRKCWMVPAVVFPVSALLLFLCSDLTSAPGIVYGLLIPILVFPILYPLLYTGASRGVATAFNIISLAASLYVMGVLELFSGRMLILHVALFIFYAGVVFKFTKWFAKKIGDDVCPHCGYYAGHPRLGEEYMGTSTSVDTDSYDQYDHSETVGHETTNYYVRKYFHRITHTDHYDVERCCLRCGSHFQNAKTRTRGEML